METIIKVALMVWLGFGAVLTATMFVMTVLSKGGASRMDWNGHGWEFSRRNGR